MADVKAVHEQELLSVSDGEEQRTVSAIWGTSLAVMEQSRGPVTEVAYGTVVHGHKILCAREACGRALGVDVDLLEQALVDFFAQDEDPLLSDLMDRFDQAGERYTYTAWSADGDAAFRPAAR